MLEVLCCFEKVGTPLLLSAFLSYFHLQTNVRVRQFVLLSWHRKDGRGHILFRHHLAAV